MEVDDNKEDDDNDDIDGHPGDFMGDESNASPELGHNATSQLPMACHQLQISIASPPKHSPALWPSSFAPVISNPTPSMDGAVKVDPNFFEGTADDGSGPGPHFITMSVIKDKGKICEKLLSALTQTVTILTDNLLNALIHGITKNTKNTCVPPLPNATCSHFSASGMQANNYMFVPNAWLLTPDVRNKPKLPAPKVGKDAPPPQNVRTNILEYVDRLK
jgi:hypothetical protein